MKLKEIENYYITQVEFEDKRISDIDMVELFGNELIFKDEGEGELRIVLNDDELEVEEIERERISEKLFYAKFDIKNKILYLEIMDAIQSETIYLEELGEYKRKIIDLLGKRAILIDNREHKLKSNNYIYIDGEKSYLNILESIRARNLYTVRAGEGKKDERAILILSYLKKNLTENISIDECLELLYKEVENKD